MPFSLRALAVFCAIGMAACSQTPEQTTSEQTGPEQTVPSTVGFVQQDETLAECELDERCSTYLEIWKQILSERSGVTLDELERRTTVEHAVIKRLDVLETHHHIDEFSVRFSVRFDDIEASVAQSMPIRMLGTSPAQGSENLPSWASPSDFEAAGVPLDQDLSQDQIEAVLDLDERIWLFRSGGDPLWPIDFGAEVLYSNEQEILDEALRLVDEEGSAFAWEVSGVRLTPSKFDAFIYSPDVCDSGTIDMLEPQTSLGYQIECLED